MNRTPACAAVAALLVATVAVAQDVREPEQKLQPYLRDMVRLADPTKKIPVYFVMADRLGYDHWFPRVFQMKLAQRRTTVVRELREHAETTQRDLLEYLAAEQAAGGVDGVRSNWLGNFVQANASPLAILTAATDASVAEVWFDHVPPREAVEDDDRAVSVDDFVGPPPPPPQPATPATATATRVPGNGPTAVFADRVWALGFEGQGVLAMNVDGGIDTNPAFHTDLAANMWNNPGEIPGNGIDDDNNGYIDDLHGWNFDGNNSNLDDAGGHGSSTSGCIAANGTCNGTTYGMAPACTLMIGKINGELSQWNAIQYAVAMGADTQTSSYSYKSYFNPPPNYKMHRDIGVTSLAAGLIRTNSTSNDGSQCSSTTNAARKPFNISAPGNLPNPYMDPNQTLQGQLGGVIGVAAWNFTANTLMSYSPCGPFAWNLPDLLVNVPTYPAGNWSAAYNDYPWTGGSQQGLLKPDISSPTSTTTTTSAPCSFGTFSGTSNATPCAQGVLVLWKSANPSLSPEDVAMIVHQTADDRGSVPGKENNWGAGVINAERGLFGALCVHRADGQPQWQLDHSVASGPAQYAIDGVPSSPAVVILGFSRTTISIGPVTIGVGAAPITLAFGITDAAGDLTATLGTSPALVGYTLFSQGLLLDNTVTGQILSSNVIGLRFTP